MIPIFITGIIIALGIAGIITAYLDDKELFIMNKKGKKTITLKKRE